MSSLRPRAPVGVLQAVASPPAADLAGVPDPLRAVGRGVVRERDVRAPIRTDLDLEEVEQRAVAPRDAQDSDEANVPMVDAGRIRTGLLDRRLGRVRIAHLREVEVPVV